MLPVVRRVIVGLTVAGGLAATTLALPAGAGPRTIEFTGVGRSAATPVTGPVTTTVGEVAPSTRATGTIGITGSVAGLYPGAVLPLTLTVVDAGTKSVTVTSVTVRVANASKVCKRGNLTVSPFTGGHLVVPAGGRATVTVTAAMSFAAGDACQGAVFDLTYRGKATTP